jgi:hypothetical protein
VSDVGEVYVLVVLFRHCGRMCRRGVLLVFNPSVLGIFWVLLSYPTTLHTEQRSFAHNTSERPRPRPRPFSGPLLSSAALHNLRQQDVTSPLSLWALT